MNASVSSSPCKYILLESPLTGIFPLIFPGHIGHDTIARAMAAETPGAKPISAGFCSHTPDSVSVWGESRTLGLKSHPEEDAVWLGKMLCQGH